MFNFDNFVFQDSMSFMNSSLDTLIKLNKYAGKQRRDDWKAKFPHRSTHLSQYIKSDEDLNVLTEKGVYPYGFMDDISKFNLEQLPDHKGLALRTWANTVTCTS